MSGLTNLLIAETTQGVPDAPIIISASVSDTVASISFNPPANNNGLSITGYYFYSVEDPTKNTTTLTSPAEISNLSYDTSYSFVGYGINGYGNGKLSSNSNSIIPGPTVGSQLFTNTGAQTFTVPPNVNSICILLVGGGGGGSGFSSGSGGGGGAMTYLNNLSVTPGDIYNIFVGRGGSGGATTPPGDGYKGQDSWFSSNTFLFAGGGYGGAHLTTGSGFNNGGGGGAAGYTVSGGRGGSATAGSGGATALGGLGGTGSGSAPGRVSFSGGRGGNGASSTSFPSTSVSAGTGSGPGGAGGSAGVPSQGGGGVWYYGPSNVDYDGYPTTAGLYNASGYSSVTTNGGSGGKSAVKYSPSYTSVRNGGLYGGGGSGGGVGGSTVNAGANGFIRIIWGPGRAWPSTMVDSSYP